MRKYSLAPLAVACLFAGIGSAYAVTATFHATIGYRSALAITQTVAMDFGYVKAGTAATYTLDTNNGLTTVGGAAIGGTPKTGQYAINGSALINITATNFSTPATNGAVLSAPVCNYNGAGDVNGCSLIGTSATGGGTLKVGFKVATTVAGTDGLQDTPKFDLTVVYQ